MSGGAGTALRVAGWTGLVSAVLAAVGIAFLAAMFVSFAVGATSAAQAFGRINDVLVLIAYLLAAPSIIALSLLLRPYAPVLVALLAVVAIGAVVAIVLLQLLLVVGAVTFEAQVGAVSIALLVLGAWFVATGYLGRVSRLLPHGVRLGILAATYVGYPIWALATARRLAATASMAPTTVGHVPLTTMKE